MRLIINLGNSDLKLLCKNSNQEFVFRKREEYFKELNNLINAIEKNEIKFKYNGELENNSIIEYIDSNQNKYEIERIDFPILKAEIEQIEVFENKKITEVVCFVTKQIVHNYSDTYLLKNILNGIYGKTVFPNIKFIFVTITLDPSDYSTILPMYGEFISKINLENSVVSIAQGTPAMCFGLSQSCARIKPNLHQYYASNDNNFKQVKIKKMDQFSRIEKENLINQLETYLSIGDYDYAKSFVKNSYLSISEPIFDIIDYFIYRKNYKFDEANEKIFALSKKTTIFDEIILPIKKNLSYIIEANPESFNYSNKMCPYLLYESFSNIRLSLIKKDYFYTMALMSSLLDVIADFMIVRALNLDGMNFNNKTSSYPEVDRFVEDKMHIYPMPKSKYKDLVTKLKESDGEYHLLLNRPSRRHLLHWVRDNMGIDKTVSKYLEIIEKYKGFEQLKNLRNKLPIAHSVKGISLEAINNTLRETDSTNNINKAIDDLESLINIALPIDDKFEPYYIDSSKFVLIIKDYFLS